MYSLGAYGSMIADRVRAEAYAEALRRTVCKGSVFAEIGTGPGVFAVLACQLGASRVFAIEPAEIIQVAREVAAANGCAGKIEFFELLSHQVTLPTRADVVLSDLRGVLPFFRRHIPSIVDARQRFLAPGGTMIPRKDTVWAAVVEAPKAYSEVVDPWDQNPFGQNLESARRLAVNNLQRAKVSPGQVLTAHKPWTTLDYGCVESPDAQGDLEWSVGRDGTGHGIVVWFDTDLAEGAGFSNAPGSPTETYGSVFFPWTKPVSLTLGQNLRVSLKAKLVEDDYLWRWTTRIEPKGTSSGPLIQFDQSELGGALLSAVRLHKMAADYVPLVSEEGRLRCRTLELMNGKLSLEEIAHCLAKEFPERFPEWRRALSYAGAVAQEHCL